MIYLKSTLLVAALMSGYKVFVKHPILLLPVAGRLGCFLIKPIFDYCFHKGAHSLIHMSAKRLVFMEALFAKFKYAPDVLMILALIILQMIMG